MKMKVKGTKFFDIEIDLEEMKVVAKTYLKDMLNCPKHFDTVEINDDGFLVGITFSRREDGPMTQVPIRKATPEDQVIARTYKLIGRYRYDNDIPIGNRLYSVTEIDKAKKKKPYKHQRSYYFNQIGQVTCPALECNEKVATMKFNTKFQYGAFLIERVK